MRNISDVNVAVIGGAGFLGSHLVDYLIENRNCNVIVLDNLISGRRDFIHPKAIFLWHDITHSEMTTFGIFRDYKIDYVFNYAAEPYVPLSYERPLHIFKINAMGALKCINAAMSLPRIKGFLQISSAEIYGDVSGKIKETSPVKAHSSYGSSKLAIDMLIQARYREAKIRAISLRQFNCVGERDILHPYVIPEIIYQAKKSNVIRLGNNTQRDFLYAGDQAKCAVELLEKGEFGEVYNLGSEEVIKIYDLAKLIGRIMGKDIVVQTDQWRRRPWDIESLWSDNSKIYSVIDYRPQVNLEEALRRTIRDLERRYEEITSIWPKIRR